MLPILLADNSLPIAYSGWLQQTNRPGTWHARSLHTRRARGPCW